MTSSRPLSARVRRRRTAAVVTLAALVAVAFVVAREGLGRVLADGSRPRPAAGTPVSGGPRAQGAARAAPARSATVLTGVYGHTGVGQFTAATRGVPYLLYVPESAGTGVDVVDPVRLRVIGHYTTGLDPQHVVPSYDLKTLWSTNDLANSLTPFDPRSGRPSGPSVAVEDPYNMYFAPGGRQAIVVAEARQQLEFYDAHTFAPLSVTKVDCAGVDHADFSADEKTMVASCEFAHRLLRLDLATRAVTGYLDLPGSSPQDVRLSPDGRVFFVADKDRGGVHLIDARRFRDTGFLPTGPDAHGIYPSRDGTRMFVSNRGNGTISVLDPVRRRIVTTWTLPGGGSPDMGGLSPDGAVLWLSGRYHATIYKISTRDGRLLGSVHVPQKPHGLSVWPQPGRYSLGHTGNMR